MLSTFDFAVERLDPIMISVNSVLAAVTHHNATKRQLSEDNCMSIYNASEGSLYKDSTGLLQMSARSVASPVTPRLC